MKRAFVAVTLAIASPHLLASDLWLSRAPERPSFNDCAKLGHANHRVSSALHKELMTCWRSTPIKYTKYADSGCFHESHYPGCRRQEVNLCNAREFAARESRVCHGRAAALSDARGRAAQAEHDAQRRADAASSASSQFGRLTIDSLATSGEQALAARSPVFAGIRDAVAMTSSASAVRRILDDPVGATARGEVAQLAGGYAHPNVLTRSVFEFSIGRLNEFNAQTLRALDALFANDLLNGRASLDFQSNLAATSSTYANTKQQYDALFGSYMTSPPHFHQSIAPSRFTLAAQQRGQGGQPGRVSPADDEAEARARREQQEQLHRQVQGQVEAAMEQLRRAQESVRRQRSPGSQPTQPTGPCNPKIQCCPTPYRAC